ncbi:MAG: FMN-binding protein [Proteobacteria bacterium]|nr:FMN-binding protein [Pseudomonadota bacterium]
MKKRWFSVLYMFVLTLVCTGLLTGIQEVNGQRIEVNRQARENRVILSVLLIPVPADADNARAAEIYAQRVREVRLGGKTVYQGLGKDGTSILGWAFPLSGPGFWGAIQAMMGVSPDLETVLGVEFYDQNETPGLGGRITEAWFTDQFAGKRLIPDAKGRFFYLVSSPEKDLENQVDAITGASQTSIRVQELMNDSIREYLDLLRNAAPPGASPSLGA